jgi:23S rRNA (pseudouridine1915-N3)-methyltransferase
MRLTIAAVGRLKQGPERQLAERYGDRAAKAGRTLGFRSLDIVEVDESRAREAERRMLEESIAIANLLPEGAAVVLLDEQGDHLDSRKFAETLGRWRDDGRQACAFVIGGPDGVAASLRDKATLRLALGTLTWPHQLVRVLLLEQLYRATTILAGHPYHRV